MSRRMTIIGVIICLVALASFAAWPIWNRIATKEASAALSQRTKATVDKKPELKPSWDEAMNDGKLTQDEARDILEKAGETVGPDE